MDRRSFAQTVKGRTFWYAFFFASVFFLPSFKADAASVYFAPARTQVSVGQTFTISAYLSSPDQPANAVSAKISFPSDLFSGSTISKSGTIISLWVKDPSMSSSAASFEGVILNPGYRGTGGRLVTMTFRARAVGTGTIRFGGVQILANDGNGTNIYTGAGSATVTVVAAKTPEKPLPKPPEKPTPLPPPPEKPLAPQVGSASHPDPTQWYRQPDISYQWTGQPGVTAVQTAFDQSPDTVPSHELDASSKAYASRATQDGVWYFHIRFKNAGGWGAISHFKTQIDTTAPDRLDIVKKDEALPIGKASFLILSADRLSGVAFYRLELDGGTEIIWRDDGSHTFIVGPLSAGSHTLKVRGVDQAGNEISGSAVFAIEEEPVAPPPPPPPVQPPIPTKKGVLLRDMSPAAQFVFVFAILALLLFLFALPFLVYLFFTRRRKEDEEKRSHHFPVSAAEIHRVLAQMYDDIEAMDRVSRGRTLTPEEKNLHRHLKESVDRLEVMWQDGRMHEDEQKTSRGT